MPDTFLSYARVDTEFAEQIDRDFQSVGITFRRDVRDVGYRENFKEFMHGIHSVDFMVMLISDAYLRSPNCMYEVIELLNTHKLEERILPVLLPSAIDIFNAGKRADYYDFWKSRLDACEACHTVHMNDDTGDELKKHRNINNYLPDFFNRLKHLNVHTLEALKAANYKPILDLMGVEDGGILENVLAIARMDNFEEQELALEKLLKTAPNNFFALFLRAWLQVLNARFLKAGAYFEEVLNYHPADAMAHNNLAILLTKYPEDYQRARHHFSESLNINPESAETYCNLAKLVSEHFDEYDKAYHLYLEALRLNQEDADSHYNFANLLTNHLEQHSKARYHFEQSIRIKPNHASAHNDLAALLLFEEKDISTARTHYLKAISLNPSLKNPDFEKLLDFPEE